jgi:hypothetical protein
MTITITGHKAPSVFDRYHIVSPADLKAATERIAARDRHAPNGMKPEPRRSQSRMVRRLRAD